MKELPEITYEVSLHPSKFHGYQSKKGNEGQVKLFVSSIWEISENFEDFLTQLNYIMLIETYCLERAFNKVRIPGGMCNPCCVKNLAKKTMDLLLEVD